MADMDLAAICEVLKGTQLSDVAARKSAEQHLEEASSNSPNQLVCGLVQVLAANGVASELRQEAAVILRQLVKGISSRPSVWEELETPTKKMLMNQLLGTLEHDASRPVKRNAGQVVSVVATEVAEDLAELRTEWPELLPALSRFVGGTSRVVALEVLKDLVPTFGDGLMAQGEQVTTMLSATLADTEPDVRAAGAELTLQLIEDLDPDEVDMQPLQKVMPAVILALQDFAKGAEEEQLKNTLQALVSAAGEEPEFFRDSCLEALWPTLVELCTAGPEAFADQDVRHIAMEASVSLATGLVDDFSKLEGQALLERLIGINIEWMLEVEEDVDQWTSQGKDKNEDDCDDDVVEDAEQNLDRLAEKFEEDVFMPLLFKLIRAAELVPNAGWKHARAAVMALSQVVEHIVETAWVDQCVDFIVQKLTHQHPRVRYAAFWAVSQVAYDHAPHVQETHHETLLPAIAVGLQDVNIRVATNAVEAFTSLADDLDCDDLEPHLKELLTGMFARLNQGETRAMQETCLSGIASVAEVMEELFLPYYPSVVPALKQIIANALGEEDRSLRGKAFECVSLIGSVVDKDTFEQDAHQVMEVMTKMVQAGIAADDPQRESVRDASRRIAEALGKDFKPYVPALLPIIFETLKNKPAEVDPDDMPDEDCDDEQDMSLQMVNGKLLKTSVLEEMASSLDLARVFVDSLEEEFCEFLPATCQSLLPLLDIQLSEELQEKAFKTWETLVECARNGVKHGRLEGGALQELVSVFLEKVVGALRETVAQSTSPEEESLKVLQARAIGVSGVIRKAGAGVLTKEGVKNISDIIGQLISGVPCAKEETAEKGILRRRNASTDEDDEDDEDDDGGVVTPQSVRFALADVAGALMHANPEDFCAVALHMYMQFMQRLLQHGDAEHDRGLAFYIADDVVDCLGERSIPYWNWFMEQALAGVLDKSAVVRQYASSTIGNGARQAIFAQMAPAAASQLHRVLQKQGERHRRRRAVKAEAKQGALAVDAGIRALGEISEHHEQHLGENAKVAWAMWLSNLPLKYDQDAGQRAHAQLLSLVSRRHPAITSPQQLPQVVSILAEVYKTKFSNAALDRDIGTAMASIGETPLKQVCSNLQEKHQKKVEHILQGAKAGA